MPNLLQKLRGLIAVAALLGCGLFLAASMAREPSATACGLLKFESELLQSVNDFRAASRRCGARGEFEAAPPLKWSPMLAALAATHARSMAARNRVGHNDAQGRAPAERATAAGYRWQVFAENVAGNYASTAEVMRGWQNSPGHCANLMNPAVSELGVACAPGVAGSAYKTYWAMELAKPR